MQTVGYWCDECRMKYVQHKCWDGLPCGHDKWDAIKVYAKAYGTTTAQDVNLSWYQPSAHAKDAVPEREHVRLVVSYRPQPDTMYASVGKELWAYEITLEDGTAVRVGDWLKMQPEKIRRAFMERWSSYKEPPVWRQLSL